MPTFVELTKSQRIAAAFGIIAIIVASFAIAGHHGIGLLADLSVIAAHKALVM